MSNYISPWACARAWVATQVNQRAVAHDNAARARVGEWVPNPNPYPLATETAKATAEAAATAESYGTNGGKK